MPVDVARVNSASQSNQGTRRSNNQSNHHQHLPPLQSTIRLTNREASAAPNKRKLPPAVRDLRYAHPTKNNSCIWFNRPMANPAELLFNQLSKWRASDKTALKARPDTNDLALHRRAIQNLNDIRSLLLAMQNAGKRVGVWNRAFPRWTQIIFCYPHAWRDDGSGSIEQKDLDDLETLIDALDPYVTKLDESSFQNFRNYLDEIENTLEEDDSLDEHLKESVRIAVRNVREAFDQFTTVGDYRTDEALKSLLAQISLVMVKSHKKNKWEKILNSWVFPYAVNQFPPLDPGNGLLTMLMPSSQ